MIGAIIGTVVMALWALAVAATVIETGIFRGGATHVEEDAELYEDHRRILLADEG